MLKIAITGGIASGKSFVSKIIQSLGYKVFDADKIYADFIKDEQVVLKICEILSIDPILENNTIKLNKPLVSEKVFNDKKLLEKLNNYTHSLVYNQIDLICAENHNDGLLFFEIPLLFESKKEDSFDKVVVVLRDKTARIDSAVLRSGLLPEDIIKRMKNQIDYDNFDFTKHTVLYNDCSIDELKGRVKSIVKTFESEIFANI